MFVGKAKSIPKFVANKKVLHLGRLQPYQQTLDKTRKVNGDEHFSLLRTLANYSLKKLDNIGPWLNVDPYLNGGITPTSRITQFMVIKDNT